MKQTKLAEVAKNLNLSEKEVLKKIGYIFHDNRPQPRIIHLTSNDELKHYNVTCKGIGNIINEFGEFIEYAFEVDDRWQDYSVLVKAKKFDSYRMPIFEMRDYFLTRFDSHCETQMLFGDKTCDCMEQLHMAMDLISQHGEGAIIHIKKHEGRGKGIGSKLDQLSICHDLGIDTVAASLLRAELIENIDTTLFTPTQIIDSRDFLGCVSILKYFGVPTRIKLMLQTNNPMKMKALNENGYQCEFFNIHTEPNEQNRHHLASKKEHLNHKL